MVVLDKIKLWRIPMVVRDRVDFHDQDPLLIPLRFLFHNYCLNPFPHHLWFCDTDHANCSTGSVAHGFNSYWSEKTQWLKRILHPAAQNKHRGEATAKKPRRQEPCGQKRHTANSTVLTPAGQKHHSGWKEFCPPLVRKDTVANPLRRYHDSKAPCDIVYWIGSVWNREMLWRSEKTHRRPRCSAPLLENEPVPRS